jgi:hypothetical protein
MKARTFDKKFDSGKSVLKALDLKKASRLSSPQKRVNVDFPIWMVESLDREADRMGVTRQSVIKMLIADHLSEHVSGKQG